MWVEPRPAAFHLTANMQETKHAEGGGVAVSGGESEVTVGNSDSSAVGKRAEETAARVLSGRRVAGNDDARGTLLDALTTCRETTEDVFWVPVGPGETALVPYRTRFNAPSRARRSGGRVEAAFRNAREEGHERALLVTLTTDPARHESVRAALDALGENVSRFKSWYAGRFNGGSRQPWVVVREVTESGLPHAHIVLFGEGSRRTRWCPTIRRRGGTTARWCGATVWRYAVGRGYGRGVGRVMDRARGTLRADGRRGRVGQWGICRRWAVTWRRSHW